MDRSRDIFRLLSDSFECEEPVTIGVDAFAFRTFYEGGTMHGARKQQFSNGFVFNSGQKSSEFPEKW